MTDVERQMLRQVFTPQAIEEMVHAFYDQVREDELLGPVFAAKIDDWTPHLDRMVSFWRNVLLGEACFKASPRGGPPALHRQLAEVDHTHFDRWLALFAETTEELFPPFAAEHLAARSRRMATVLSAHLPTRVAA